MRRYIVSVDRDLLDKSDPRDEWVEPVRVEDTSTGEIQHGFAAELIGARITYNAPRQDGTRVYIEADNVCLEQHLR